MIELSNEVYLRLINQRDEARGVLRALDNILCAKGTPEFKIRCMSLRQDAIDEVLGDVGWDLAAATGELANAMAAKIQSSMTNTPTTQYPKENES